MSEVDHEMNLQVPGLPAKPAYKIEAETPIREAFGGNRKAWINVPASAIATTALTALTDAGWRLLPPAGPRRVLCTREHHQGVKCLTAECLW